MRFSKICFNMATASAVQDGDHRNIKWHPHVLTLMRWCVSWVWSASTVLLHRLLKLPPMVPSLPTIAALMRYKSLTTRIIMQSRKCRSNHSDAYKNQRWVHLDPEPKVECVVLYEPEGERNMDIIFAHGLYGSLGNTWRQGDWSTKYKIGPNRTSLRRSACIPSPCTCNQSNINDTKFNCTCSEIRKKYKKEEKTIGRSKEDFICNKLDEDIERTDIINCNVFNFKEFYRDEKEEEMLIQDEFYQENSIISRIEIFDNYETQSKFVNELFNCDIGGHLELETDCNSDDSAVDLQFCDKTDPVRVDQNDLDEGVVKECSCLGCREQTGEEESKCPVGCGCVCSKCYSPCWPRDWLREDYPNARVISINYTSDPYLWRPIWIKGHKRLRLHERAEQMTTQLLDLGVGRQPIIWVGHSKGGLFIKQIYSEAYEAHLKLLNTNNQVHIFAGDVISNEGYKLQQFSADKSQKSNSEININNIKADKVNLVREQDNMKTLEIDDRYDWEARASLWSGTSAFMFYSVPHRGSPLADFKTPVTARSIELLEICKDRSELLVLQDRWLQATRAGSPLVRSLVETCRTLMSVLWLRIVSVESADAGVGALCGVSVDHREICKPSSRSCLLYTELLNLINAALNKYHNKNCQC